MLRPVTAIRLSASYMISQLAFNYDNIESYVNAVLGYLIGDKFSNVAS